MMRTIITYATPEALAAWREAAASEQQTVAEMKARVAYLDDQIARVLLVPPPLMEQSARPQPPLAVERAYAEEFVNRMNWEPSAPAKTCASPQLGDEPTDPQRYFTDADWAWWRRWATTEPW